MTGVWGKGKRQESQSFNLASGRMVVPSTEGVFTLKRGKWSLFS